jgi:ABC-type amino acid transport substrate-binding protein
MVQKFFRSKLYLLLQLVLIIFPLALLTACGPQSDNSAGTHRDSLQRILQTGELRVGYVVVPPWIIKEPNRGQLSGSSIEAIQEIARLAGLKLIFVEASWSTYISGLQTGQFDLSIVPSYVTVGRAKAMNFTRPISYTGNTALVRADDKRFKDMNDLNASGVTVAVVQGTQDHEYALKNFPLATIKAIATQDVPLLFTEVATGRADVALADTYNVRNFLTQHSNLKELTPEKPYNILPAAWNVRYEDVALWQFINSSLVYLEGNNVLLSLNRKYNIPIDRSF